MPSVEIIVIAGPTASGKSSLALELAETLNGIIINADSMQVYKEIPILAATPSLEDTARVPHRLYGIYDASVRGNVVDWLERCLAEINSAKAQGKMPIIVGGTGMYIEALTKGATPIPETPDEIRKEIEEMLQTKGLGALYDLLKEKDPQTANRLSPNDTTRIRRALEIERHTKKPLSYWHKQPLKKVFAEDKFLKIYINPPRPILDERARLRFDMMIKQGAIEEVQALVARNLPDSLPAMRALGVQELKSYINNELTLEAAIEAAKLHTRQYAKRQTTWFNNRFEADFKYEDCYKTDKKFVDVIKKQV